MRRRHRPSASRALLLLLLAASAAGCGSSPYIYKHEEFNRGAKDFNQEPTDREAVTICYSGFGTSDGEVAKLAQAECGRFGRTARPSGETFGACPLFTPVEAHFACVRTAAVPQ